jgi:hypothetical protein
VGEDNTSGDGLELDDGGWLLESADGRETR